MRPTAPEARDGTVRPAAASGGWLGTSAPRALGERWHSLCLATGMDWTLVDVDRLHGMRCPSCQRNLGGGLMRQVEWTTKRCVVVVVCPSCNAECMAILDTRSPNLVARPVIDVDDVLRAHELLGAREWRVEELFAV